MRSLFFHALISALLMAATFFAVVRADQPLDLGLAQPYAILAGSEVTSTGTVGTVVTGDIGIFPGHSISGFPPAVINGAIDSANGASGGAQGALTTAYNALAAKPLGTSLSDQDLGGMTLLPGVYKFDEAAAMNGMLTLDANGDSSAIWTFQIGSAILIAEGSSIIFKDSIGNPDYVYWQVGTTATLAKGVPMIGNILALTSIVVNDGATVTGRCLARNAEVTLDRSVITIPEMQPSDSQPSSQPSAQPSSQPSTQPSISPSAEPSAQPSAQPTTFPSSKPSMRPSSHPTSRPSTTSVAQPIDRPTSRPSTLPSSTPTARPTTTSSLSATAAPSSSSTAAPSAVTTVHPIVNQAPLDLGLAEPYAILAGTTVTSTGTVGTVVTGNIGIFPGTAITGFPPAVLNGAVDSANGASGSAQGSLTTAYNVLAAKHSNVTLSNQDLGGLTLVPGVYKFDGTAAMNGALTLDANGNAAAVWVFQVASTLLIAEGSSIVFKDSIGNPDYVYWQVGTTATLANGVSMVGNILALASIVVNDGVVVRGRCLALYAAVTLDKSVITKPTTVSFSAKQTISGVNLEDFNADPTKNSATLKEAIAETMTGVLPSNIKTLEASSGSTSARSAGSFNSLRIVAAATTAAHPLSTADSIVVTYDVVVSSTKTAEELKAQLTAAVADGTFNIYLQMAATANGATAFQGATSETIATENVDTSTGSSSDSDSLSAGAIAGIVIGCFVGLVLIAMLIYYFLYSSGASAGETEVTTVEV